MPTLIYQDDLSFVRPVFTLQGLPILISSLPLHLAPPSYSLFLVPPISVTNNGVRDYTVRLVTTLGNIVATKSNNNPQDSV
jgi:hypothetical protein